MNYFHYVNDELYAEEVPIRKIASQVGTPFYVYSYKTLQRHFSAVDSAFGEKLDHLICFAVKANSNLAILNLLGRLGAGADIVSGGELFRALKAGILPEKIVYAGVGKTRREMEYALQSGILMFNVESWPELELLNRVAGELNKKASIALRVNPDISADTHPYITTGLRQEKFGIDIHRALEEYKRTQSLEHLKIVGAHVHIGSQITKVTPFMDSLQKVATLIQKLREEKIQEGDLKIILEKIVSGVDLKEAVKLDKKDLVGLEEKIKEIIENKPGLSSNAYMGLIMKEFKGSVNGKEVMEIIGKIVS